MRKKILIPVIIGTTALSIFIYSCRKEILPDQLPDKTGAYALTTAPDYTEADITSFITTVTDPSQATQSMMAPVAIGKLNATLNYVFSDVDTALLNVITVSHNFTIPLNSGTLTVGNLATAARDINNFIVTLTVSNNRVSSCRIIDNGGGSYTANFDIGASSNNIISSITDGAHPWYADYDGNNNNNGVPLCAGSSDGTAKILKIQGAALLSAFTASHINKGVPYGWQAYLDQKEIYDLSVPGSGGRTNIEYTDVVSLSSGIPTSPLYVTSNTPSAAYPAITSAIFAANKIVCAPDDPTQQYASYGLVPNTAVDGTTDSSYNVEIHYNYCLPQEHINYYISKVPVIFEAFRPDSDCFPMVNESNVNHTPDFNVYDILWNTKPVSIYWDGPTLPPMHHGYTVMAGGYYNKDRTNINHTYTYKYQRRKLRQIASWPIFAAMWLRATTPN